MKGELHAVQKEALRRSNGAPGFAYYMEQGLGKSLTSLADFAERVAERTATRLFIEAPNSFKAGWKYEIEKWGFDFDVFVWEAGNETYLRSWIKRGFKKPPALIMNWESARAKKVDIGGGRKRWTTTSLMDMIATEYVGAVNGRAMGVWDESVKAKDPSSAQTRGALRLSKEFDFKRVLSGKPIVQGPHDLWAQMRIIGHLDGMEFYPFRNAFCKMGGFQGKQIIGAMNEDILAERIDPVIFRASKADWTDLPPKVYSIREYTMSPEQKAQFDSMYNDFVLWLNSDEVVTVDAAITKYIKLAQIQCGWIYDEDRKIRQLVPDERNPRLKLLLELVNEEVVGKVAIPYHHKPVFDQLLRNLGGENNCAWIRGGMPSEEVEEQKRRFNEDRSVRFILLQDDASKYGHTLLGLPEPGYMCYTMIPYENSYSLDTRSQIEDRVHRHGQIADSVSYIDLAGTTLDRDCIRALQRKENVFQAVFSLLRK